MLRLGFYPGRHVFISLLSAPISELEREVQISQIHRLSYHNTGESTIAIHSKHQISAAQSQERIALCKMEQRTDNAAFVSAEGKKQKKYLLGII